MQIKSTRRCQPHTCCTHAKLLQLCLTQCDPMNSSLPGSSVHGILQARILELVAMPFSRASSWPRDQTHVSCIAGRFLTAEPRGNSRHLWGCIFSSQWFTLLWEQRESIHVITLLSSVSEEGPWFVGHCSLDQGKHLIKLGQLHCLSYVGILV